MKIIKGRQAPSRRMLMEQSAKNLLVTLITGSLLLVGPVASAKPTNIGVGAIVVDSSLVGKGEFKTNDNIITKDQIITRAEGSTTILFNDESMLTLGPNAQARIAVYDEGDEKRPGQSHIQILKGTFRFFPGDILENGGAQFIIAGDKAVGASNGKLKPVFATKKNGDKTAPGQVGDKTVSEDASLVPIPAGASVVPVSLDDDASAPEFVAATETDTTPDGGVTAIPISIDIEAPEGGFSLGGANTAVVYMKTCEICPPPGLLTIQPGGQVFSNPLAGPGTLTLPGVESIAESGPSLIGMVFQGTVTLDTNKGAPVVDLVVTDADNNIFTQVSQNIFVPQTGTVVQQFGKNGTLVPASTSKTGVASVLTGKPNNSPATGRKGTKSKIPLVTNAPARNVPAITSRSPSKPGSVRTAAPRSPIAPIAPAIRTTPVIPIPAAPRTRTIPVAPIATLPVTPVPVAPTRVAPTPVLPTPTLPTPTLPTLPTPRLPTPTLPTPVVPTPVVPTPLPTPRPTIPVRPLPRLPTLPTRR